MRGEDIFLPQTKTTFAPRKRESKMILWYLGHLASISVLLGRMGWANGMLMSIGGESSAASGVEDIFLPGMITTFSPKKKERGKIL